MVVPRQARRDCSGTDTGMKKVVVAVVVLAGLVIAAIAVVVGLHSFATTPKSSSAVEREYERTTKSFPIPLPAGQAYPQSAPPQQAAGVHYEKGVGSAFVSFYDKCAWERAALAEHNKGDGAALKIALANLTRWNNLPASVSQADNTDHGWRDYVLTPAQSGEFSHMTKDIAGSCDLTFYRTAGK